MFFMKSIINDSNLNFDKVRLLKSLMHVVFAGLQIRSHLCIALLAVSICSL